MRNASVLPILANRHTPVGVFALEKKKPSWGTAILIAIGAYALYNYVRGIDQIQVNFKNLDISKISPLTTKTNLYLEVLNPSLVSVSIRAITGNVTDQDGKVIATMNELGGNQAIKANAASVIEVPLYFSNLTVLNKLYRLLSGSQKNLSVTVNYAIQTNLAQLTGKQTISVL